MGSNQSSFKADIILAIVLLIGCGFVYWECLALPESMYEPLGPAFVPKTLCVLIGLTSLWVLFEGIKKFRATSSSLSDDVSDGDTATQNFVRHPFLAVYGVILMLGYISSMHFKLLGFRPATMLFIVVLGGLLCKYEKKNIQMAHLAILLIIACVMGLGGFYLFTKVFVVNLP